MITKDSKNAKRKIRQIRVRKKITGTPARPRLNVYRSLKNIYAQVIDDVNGDWLSLIGHPLLVADKRESGESEHEKSDGDFWGDSNTWTFYTFRGVGGSVDVRWHGSSNGYYSEGVDFSLDDPTK